MNARQLTRRFFVSGLLAISLFASISTEAALQPMAQPGQKPVMTERQRTLIGELNLPFIENRGQINKRAAFYAHTFAGTAFVTNDGALVLSLPGKPAPKGRTPGWALIERPVSRARLTPEGTAISPTNVSVFQGNHARQWQEHLRTYAGVRIGQPWPGIGYAVQAHGNTVERIFTVQPEANADAICMEIKGASQLRLDDGTLIAQTGNGPVTLSKPIAFQTIDGQRKPVRVAYELNGNRYGFKLGSYDKHRPLVIDPLVQATYLGGSAEDDAYTLALSSSGQVYVAGQTYSADFPTTLAGMQTTLAGGTTDAFVALLSGDLKTLVQATYLGGSGTDQVRALKLGTGGQVYVAGNTTSSTDFPSTSGGAQAAYGGGQDGFVAALSGDLTTLYQSTYLGGSTGDHVYGLALGPAGQVYVAGYTFSTNFPGTTGGWQSTTGGGYDTFVVELSGDLKTRFQATYLGGSGTDYAYALAVGSNGQVYVAGSTTSSNFPGVVGGAQASSGGGQDAFVAELSSNLTNLTQATYLGGANTDVARALKLDSSGNLFVAGNTLSTDFPVSSGAAQTSNAGSNDIFVAELSGDLKTRQQATYLGGSGADYAYALELDSGGQLYLAGETNSGDFPGTSGGIQSSYSGAQDGFIATLSSDLKTIQQATYLGGTGFDRASDLALGANNQVYVAGYTATTNLPGTSGGAQGIYGGGTYDAFAARYDCLTNTACLYTVTATAGSGGSITPNSATVISGDTATFNVTPDTGYQIANVTGCSGTLTDTLYTTASITGDCTIVATFTVASTSQPPTHSSNTSGGGGAMNPWLLATLLGLWGPGLYRRRKWLGRR